MRRTLRIAAHNGAPEFGGAEIATALLLAGLRERGHEVALYYNRDVVADGARPYGIPLRHAHLGGDIAVHHAVRFARQLRRFRPDVLIVGTFRKLWLASLAARLAGVPLTVARIGLSTDTPRSAKYRFAYRRLVDLVVVNADDLAAAYREALPWAPPPRIVRIHKGVEAPPADPDRGAVRRRVRAELGIPAGATVIGGVGRLVEQKRFDRLLRALATLATEPATPSAVTPAPNPAPNPGTGSGAGVEPWCVIAGSGPLRGELEALARDLGVADRVVFTGHRSDVPDVMRALDVLVVSSDRESLANVMLESLAVGTPVVSTDVSGAREALAPVGGPDGERTAPGLVAGFTPESLAEGVREAIAGRGRMAAAARRTAEERFGRERMLDQWEAALGVTKSLARAEVEAG